MADYLSVNDNVAQALLFTAQSGASNISYVTRASRGRATAVTTIAARRQFLQRTTSGTTPTNVTEEKSNTRSRNPDGNLVSVWGTLPTLSGNPLIYVSAGIQQEPTAYWTPPRPSAIPVLINGEQLDFRDSSAAIAISGGIVISEDYNIYPVLRKITRRARERGFFGYACVTSTKRVKTGSGAYEVNRMMDYRWVTTVPIRAEREKNWAVVYGAAEEVAEPFPAGYEKSSLSTLYRM